MINWDESVTVTATREYLKINIIKAAAVTNIWCKQSSGRLIVLYFFFYQLWMLRM